MSETKREGFGESNNDEFDSDAHIDDYDSSDIDDEFGDIDDSDIDFSGFDLGIDDDEFTDDDEDESLELTQDEQDEKDFGFIDDDIEIDDEQPKTRAYESYEVLPHKETQSEREEREDKELMDSIDDSSDDPTELERFLNATNSSEDDRNALVEQSMINRQSRGYIDLPPDVSMIDDPMEEDEKPPRTRAADSKSIMNSLLAAIVVATLVICGIILFSISNMSNNNDELSAPPGNNPSGIGSPIGQGEQDDTQSDTELPPDRNTQDVDVPSGGSLVKYEISTQGDISEVSLSYVDANGEPKSLNGVALPWSESVGMQEGIKPIVKVNTRGYGTVVCTISVDGEQDSRDSQAGDSPSASCGE